MGFGGLVHWTYWGGFYFQLKCKVVAVFASIVPYQAVAVWDCFGPVFSFFERKTMGTCLVSG